MTVTPYLTAHDADALLKFYADAFGATEVLRMTADDGRVGHAEFRIGDDTFYLSDEHPEMGVRSPRSLGGASTSFVLTVDDADAAWARAVEHGAEGERPVADQFHGGRGGWVVDPAGHRWSLQTEAPPITNEELAERAGGAYEVT